MLPPQDSDRTPGPIPDPPTAGWYLRILQTKGERVRFLRGRTLLDVHFGRPGNEHRQERPQQTNQQLRGGHRRRCHHRGHGLRGHEQRGIPAIPHDCRPQRQRTGQSSHRNAQRRGHRPGLAALHLHVQSIGLQALSGLSRLCQILQQAPAGGRPERQQAHRRIHPRVGLGRNPL